MKLYEVNNNKELISDFYRIPSLIYKNDPYWIPHLIQDVEMVFSKKQNVYFTHGEATRWVLKNNNNEPVGRVAAFINKKTANTFKQPTGGMGFFECINDEKAAFVLFDACKNWLSERGIQAMDGPINFGEKDKFWGLITENFLLPPYYGQNYNPEYYVSFFKNYGFNVYYNQLVFHRKVADELQEKYVIRANRISQNKAYTLKKVEKNKLEKYAEDFRIVYNRAWQTHDGFKEMSKEQAFSLLKKIKPVIVEELIWFAYYNNTPIGFYLSLPELNEIFKYVNGNLNCWGKLKFKYHQLNKTCHTTFGVAFGIDPKFQGRGLEGALFDAHRKSILNSQFTDVIITWIGDFNPKMITIIENLGAKKIRTMATWRKLFDEKAVFERSPIIQ